MTRVSFSDAAAVKVPYNRQFVIYLNWFGTIMKYSMPIIFHANVVPLGQIIMTFIMGYK